MPKVCLLTDDAVQFPTTFSRADTIEVLPIQVHLSNRPAVDARDLPLTDLPASLNNGASIQIEGPSVEDFRQAFISLGQRFDEIVAILTSRHLNAAFANAQEAANTVRSAAALHLVDSQNTSIGLGLLVAEASELAVRGVSGVEISRQVRGWIPQVYSLFCTQSLTYLARGGLIDPAQAIAGEMLNMTPFLVLENGRFTPIQKARNPRHMGDTIHEFVSEFERVRHAALIQGLTPFAYDQKPQEVRALLERLHWALRPAPIYEYPLSTAAATILGPRSLGIVVMKHL